MQASKIRMSKKMVYIDQIPESFREYVSQIIDVKGDGNCGFRVVRSFLGQGEDNWAQVRVDLSKEMSKNDDMYMKIHKDRNVVEQLAKSLQSFQSPAGINFWMT